MTLLISDIEHAASETWTADETTDIGGWAVTSNGGFTRRTNSANAAGVADTSLDTRDAIRRWLDERGARLAIRVTPLVNEATVAGIESTWDLQRVDWTSVLSMDMPPHGGDAFGVQVVPAGDERFTADLVELNNRPDSSVDAWTRIIKRLGYSGAGLWIPGTAVGIVAVHGPIGMVYSVAVHPDFRRQGFGSLVMAAATRWAGPRGAERMALQVLGTNEPALAMYADLGYEEIYRYSYFQ